MAKREYAVVEAGGLRPFTEQDCEVQRGSKELKLALDEAAELWEGSKTKPKKQQETAVFPCSFLATASALLPFVRMFYVAPSQYLWADDA